MTVSFNSIRQFDWQFLQEQTYGRIAPAWYPEYTRNPQVVTRFQVSPGDVVTPGWTGERAERVMMVARDKQIIEGVDSGEQYFAWSVYLNGWTPPAVQPDGNQWGTVFQLHGPDVFANSPPISLSLIGNYSLVLGGGDVTPPHQWIADHYPLSDGGTPRPYKWDDFVLGVKFARDNTGWAKLWRRDSAGVLGIVAQADNVPTLCFNTAYEATNPGNTQGWRHYWKQGLYRSASPGVTHVLFQTGMVRADSYGEATLSAFGALA